MVMNRLAFNSFRGILPPSNRIISRFSSSSSSRLASLSSSIPPPPSTIKLPTSPRPISKHKKSSAKPKEINIIPLPPLSKLPTKKIKSDGSVIAISSSDSYDVTLLLESLKACDLLTGAKNLVAAAIYIPIYKYTNSEGLIEESEIFIFESGSFVSWNLSNEGAKSFLSKVIRGGSEDVDWGYIEKGRALDPEIEILRWSITKDTTLPTRMEGDLIILNSAPSPTLNSETPGDLLERLAISAGMARVTKLGLYEERFEVYADGVAGIPKALESGSESPVRKKDIVCRLGILHSFRQSLNLEDENLLEEPEFLWNNGNLERHYDEVCESLEFNSRLSILNRKVDYAFQLQSTLLELLTSKVSHRLEWIIIILIASEIGLVIYREAPMSGSSGISKE